MTCSRLYNQERPKKVYIIEKQNENMEM